MNDDPFAFDDAPDDDRTVLRPRGSGRDRTSAEARLGMPGGEHARGAGESAHEGEAARLPLLGGVNALEHAASRLLPLLVSIGRSTEEPDVPRLRERLVRELEAFKRRAREVLDEPTQVTQASYVLCTALDEAAMHTPWGHRANWAQHSLLEAFHNEVTGGERFFSLLKSLGRDPTRNRPVLELMYVLLALGYEGGYRLKRDGQATLVRVREWLYATLREEEGPPESDERRELSPHWRGSDVQERVLPRFVWAWLAALVALAVASAVWVTLRVSTGARAEETIARFWELEAPPFSAREFIPPPPAPPSAPLDSPPRPTLAELLAPDLAAGSLIVDDDATSGRVRIVGDALFGSGRADVAPELSPLLDRVARALAQFDGDLIVTGHTDSVPIRSGRWPSNLELSLARAEAVRAELARSLPPGSVLRAEGRGSLERLNEDESTPALRRENRRVEVSIEYR